MAEFLSLMENWDGQVPLGNTPVNEAAVARVIDLLANKDRLPRHKHEYLLREVITTSDFPTLFGVAIDREMLANYRAALGDWRPYCKVSRLPNFNIHERHKVFGQDNLLPQVVEKGEYLVGDVGTGHYDIQLLKYGRQFDISWEAIINDSMGAFADLAARFATAAQRTVARVATNLYAQAAGPNVLLYGAPIVDNGQNVTNLGGLTLTAANLQTTLGLMAAQRDPNGEPISVRGVHLVVPPQLEFTARGILTSALVTWTNVVAAAVPMPTTNVMSQVGIQLHVDPFLPVVDTTDGDTSWYVFADPSQGAAIEMAFLSGYEDPEICMKASDKVALGGFGGLSPFSGDFATDNVFYRVRMVVGGARLDPRYTYAQDGG
jgi:hypothetical protein